MTVPRRVNLKKKMKPFEYITLALYVIAFKVVDGRNETYTIIRLGRCT